MAVTRSQSKTGSTASGTSVALTLDSAFSLDDCLIVSVAINGGGVVSGMTWSDSVFALVASSLHRIAQYPSIDTGIEGGGIRVEKWMATRLPALENVPIVTVSVSTASAVAVIAEVFANVRRFNPYDVGAKNNGDGASLSTGTTATTGYDNELWHAVWGWYGTGSVTVGPTNLFTNTLTVAAGTAAQLYVAHKAVAATGTAESTITQDTGVTDMAAGVDTIREKEASGEPPSGFDNDMVPELLMLGKGSLQTGVR